MILKFALKDFTVLACTETNNMALCEHFTTGEFLHLYYNNEFKIQDFYVLKLCITYMTLNPSDVFGHFICLVDFCFLV